MIISWTGDGGYYLYYYSTTRKLIFYARSTVHLSAKTYTIQAYSEKFPLNKTETTFTVTATSVCNPMPVTLNRLNIKEMPSEFYYFQIGVDSEMTLNYASTTATGCAVKFVDNYSLKV